MSWGRNFRTTQGPATGATQLYLGGILALLDFSNFLMISTKVPDGFLPVFPGFGEGEGFLEFEIR
jgi:hypothetical protein